MSKLKKSEGAKREKVEISADERANLKKQTKKLIIMLIVLAVLVAAYFSLKNYNAKVAEKEAAALSETNVLFETDSAAITAFSFTYSGEEYSFVKDGEDWIYEGDTEMDMDEDTIATFLTNLSSVEYDTMIADATELDQYGLDSDYNTVKWETASESHTLYLGASNDITGDYYITTPGDANVYTVTSSFVSKFRKTAEDFEYIPEETEEESADEEEAVTEETTTDTETVSEEETTTEAAAQ